MIPTGDDPDQHAGTYVPPTPKKSKLERLKALWELADGGQEEVKEYINNLMVRMGDKEPDTIADITEATLEEAEAHFTKIPEA